MLTSNNTTKGERGPQAPTTIATEFPAGKRNRRPTHPGQVIKGGLAALGKSENQAAEDMGITRAWLNLVTSEKRALPAEIAVRYEVYIGQSGTADLLMRMQADVELWDVRRTLAPALKMIKRAPRLKHRRS